MAVPPLLVLLVFVFAYLPGWIAPLDPPASPEGSADPPPTSVPAPPPPWEARSPSPARAEGPPSSVPSSSALPPTAPSTAVPAATVAAKDPADDPEFRAAMSAGLAALEAGDHQTALRSLVRAQALHPTSRTAAEARRAAERALERASIDGQVEAGRRLADEERWAESLAAYEAALALDPAVAAAQDGAARSRRRARLDERLRRHVESPERLAEDDVAREARRALDEAREVASPGPLLAGQIEALEAQLEIFRTPVSVRLRSDGVTDVTVYRVGRLGVFEERVLDLLPGRYTVVGTRRGYRDVRRELVVTPDGAPVLTVRCEEAI